MARFCCSLSGSQGVLIASRRARVKAFRVCAQPRLAYHAGSGGWRERQTAALADHRLRLSGEIRLAQRLGEHGTRLLRRQKAHLVRTGLGTLDHHLLAGADEEVAAGSEMAEAADQCGLPDTVEDNQQAPVGKRVAEISVRLRHHGAVSSLAGDGAGQHRQLRQGVQPHVQS